MEPIFKVDVIFDPDHEIPLSEILQVKPEDFKLPPHGTSKDEDFDPTVHLELEPEKKEGEGEDSQLDEDEDVENMSFDSEGNVKRKGPKVLKQMAVTLYKRWLFIDPNRDEILTMI